MAVAELAEQLDAPEDEVRPYVLFAADRVFRAVLEALAHIEDWEPWPPFSRGYHVDLSSTFSLTVGARGLTLAEGEEIWQRLRRAPDLAAKLHFALWAAYFGEGGNPTSTVWTSLDSLVAALGYAGHPSGGYLPRDLRLVRDTLMALFGVSASGRWAPPDRRKEHTLTGGLWQEGLVAAERRGKTRQKIWVAFRPGQWFADPAWQTQNAFVGRVAAALLELDTSRDRWAIRVGMALAWLARANLGAGPILTLRVRTLAHEIGAGSIYQGRPARLRAVIEGALDRLRAVGLLGSGKWEPSHSSGAAGDWLAGSLRVEWTGATPILACNDTHPHVQPHPSSRVIPEIRNRPNRSNRSKDRPLTLRAGAASSISAGHRPTKEKNHER